MTTTMAASSATSAAADLGDRLLVGIGLSATFDGTALTFTQAPTIDGTYAPIKRNNAAYTEAITDDLSGGAVVSISDVKAFLGAQYIKIVSTATQGAAETITLYLEDL